MTLEELLRKWFLGSENISKKLARFGDNPAIFYQTAPADNQVGWREQYPRIVYTVDMQADQERKSAGTLQVSLLCDEVGTPPEEIEPVSYTHLTLPTKA